MRMPSRTADRHNEFVIFTINHSSKQKPPQTPGSFHMPVPMGFSRGRFHRFTVTQHQSLVVKGSCFTRYLATSDQNLFIFAQILTQYCLFFKLCHGHFASLSLLSVLPSSAKEKPIIRRLLVFAAIGFSLHKQLRTSFDYGEKSFAGNSSTQRFHNKESPGKLSLQ